MQAKRSKRKTKEKFLYSGLMQRVKKWYGRWGATHPHHNALMDRSVNEAFL
jgi:hypothetical protein